MHYFYIIYSKKVDRYYIGETNCLSERLRRHNSTISKKAFTKIAQDWEYALTYKTDSRRDALYLESLVKRMKSRKFIQKIISNQHILHDSLLKK